MNSTETNAAFTAEDIATLPKTIEELVDSVTEQHNQTLEEIVLCLREVSNALLRNASYAADLPAPSGGESKKREIINMWRGQADHLNMCAGAVWNQAVSPETMRDELQKMLLAAVDIFYERSSGNMATSDDMRAIMHERASNIAEAYRGRVMGA